MCTDINLRRGATNEIQNGPGEFTKTNKKKAKFDDTIIACGKQTIRQRLRPPRPLQPQSQSQPWILHSDQDRDHTIETDDEAARDAAAVDKVNGSE